MVAVRVLKTVEVVKSEPWSPLPFSLAPVVVTDTGMLFCVAVTGQIVVDTTIVSVVTNVVLAVAGQLGTVVGQAVMVAVRVESTVEVVNSSVGDPGRTVD